MTVFVSIILALFFLYFNNFLIKNNLLLSQTGELHQKFAEKKSIPLSLGFIFLIISVIVLFNVEKSITLVFILLLFILGLLSDIKIIKSPVFRLVFQIILVVILSIFLDLNISKIYISKFDQLLKNNIINIIFTSFCILILISGNNFIDGLNGLLLFLYLIILITLKLNNLVSFLDIDLFKMIFFLIVFSLILNFSNKAYLGENGVYLISIIFSYLIIKSYSLNENVSPYFYVLMLWYPAFENLFSIFRKFQFNRSPIKPDNDHLHQLLMLFLRSRLNRSNLFINNLSSIFLNLKNIIFILVGSINIYSNKIQIVLILIYSLIYISFYIRLFSFKYRKK